MSKRRLCAGFNFLDRLRQKIVHRRTNFLVGNLDALGVEIRAHLSENIVVARLVEIGNDHRLGKGEVLSSILSGSTTFSHFFSISGHH